MTSSAPRISLLLLVLLSLVVTAGCDRDGGTASTQASGSGKPKPVIGISLLTLTNPFFKEMGDAMRQEAAKQGYEVVVTSAEMDAAKQRDQVKDFIASKVGAIILTPADSRSVGTAIAEANAAGIPVFTADVANLAPEAKVVSHVATDNYGGGKLAAQAVIEALGGRGEVAILDHPQVESAIERTRGFEEELAAKGPGVKVVAKLPGGGLREPSFNATQDLLQAHPNVRAIFAMNDPSALGAVAALEKGGRAGKVKVIGFDSQPEAKQAIRDGKIYAGVVQHPQKIGTLAIDTVARYMDGQDVPKETLIPASLYRQADAKVDPALKGQ
jgi:ribose transport system substrate-binding protein